ncbi:MAG: flagellar hook protein FlgE [Rhodospirillales bacterium]|nr:flagellar hook protein FlgE [Rhodospirillales bacterium]MDE2198505.1 flagellar hook protein FlgE [Rhodospirillales bacterium]
MSIAGAMNTAISGLNAQSISFGNISDNIANSQTVGFKGTDTSFADYLTTSTATVNDPGAVVASPAYTNNVQGTVAQSNDPLGLAIAGQGFFPVSHPVGSTAGQVAFSPTPYYSRAGDFQMDKSGYLVNSAGEYLNGWSVNPATGVVDRNAVAPIQVSQSVFNPVATSQLTLAANLPATPTVGTPVSSQISVYDSLGTAHVMTLNWSQVSGSANSWTVQIVSPDDKNATPTAAVTDASGNRVLGTAQVAFGPDGTIQSLSNPVSDYGTVSGLASGPAGTPATLTFSTQFTAGTNQSINLSLGNFGQSNGVTQFAGSTYSLRGITQNGVPPGSFSSVSTKSTGDISVNYDNGQSRVIARVPIVTFNNPDALQRQDGQSFTATVDSGTPLTGDAGTNGAGNIVTGSVEQSNVDIASEFSKLIVAQNAYSANAKLITTADQLLQATIDMKR